MKKVSELILVSNWLDRVVFRVNNSFDWQSEKTINLNPTFERNIHKVNDNEAVVTICFKTEASLNLPFFLEICICGRFKLADWEKSELGRTLMTDNTSMILFPFLRHAVSDVTTLSGMPPYIIPVININNLFDK